MPTVFQWLAETGGISDHEMRRTFNCGVGFVFVVPAAAVDAALAAVTVVTEPPELPYDESPLRQVQSDLYFIRSALLDPQGPLARYLEIPHAT